MSTYEALFDRIRKAVDEATLHPLGKETFLAFENHLIDSRQMSALDQAWNARAGELGVKPPQWWSTWNARALQVTSEPDAIPIANLHRLDLKPGDRLAVIAPDWADAEDTFQRFGEMVQRNLAYADIQAVVFPPGTQLDVVSAERVKS